MPSSPVSASRGDTLRAVADLRSSCDLTDVGNKRHDNTAQARFALAHVIVVARRPNVGINKNVVSSVPITAPAVFPAYSHAMRLPCDSSAASTRSIAGSVAPIAAVAGNSTMKVPEKITFQCCNGEG